MTCRNPTLKSGGWVFLSFELGNCQNLFTSWRWFFTICYINSVFVLINNSPLVGIRTVREPVPSLTSGERMNRSQDMKLLAQNPEGRQQFTTAVRKGIVKGFFAVKAAKGQKKTEEDIRHLYKVPDTYQATWIDGSLVFHNRDEDIAVRKDGSATLLRKGEREEPWEP